MTLQGVIYQPNGDPFTGTFQMRLSHAPVDGAGGTTTGLTYDVECSGVDPVGQYSTEIRAGTYSVDVPGTPRFEVTAPDDSATYALEDLPRWANGFDPFPWLGKFRNAICDEDDSVLFDGGDALYDSLSIIDNPLAPTQAFETVAEMLAEIGGTWDTAYTRNWDVGDGNAQRWICVQDPTLVDNGEDTLETDDGLAFVRTFSTRGQSPDEQFATVGDVASAVAGLDYAYEQTTPANSWNIIHHLGRKPAVTTTNAAGKEIKGEIVYVSDTTIAVSFSRPLTGFAYLN